MLPLVSIIIPTNNRYEILGQTLDSVISQSFINWECIVVDDCSNDYTKEFLSFYVARDQRIKYFLRPRDRRSGANSCRNYGFEVSKGKFINWFDSDDLMQYNFLKRKVEALKPDYIHCSISAFRTFSIIENKKSWGSISKIGKVNVVENLILKRYPLPTNAVLWKKSFLIGKKLFDEELLISQDLDFHVRTLPPDRNLSILMEPLYFLRKGHYNMTSQFYSSIEKTFDSFFKVRKNIIEQYSSSRTIKYAIIVELMGMFRYLLARKDYRNCKIILNLIEKENDFSGRSYLRFCRVHLLFFLIKFLGRGETRFKSLLYI